jgi:nuclear pore complex protein Nup85
MLVIANTKELITTVSEITPTLQYHSFGESIFQRRLYFVVRYAEFHAHWSQGEIQDAAWDVVAMFRDELVPKAWWGILLKYAGALLLQDGMSLSHYVNSNGPDVLVHS